MPDSERSQPIPGFCRDCLSPAGATALRCASCGGPRLLRHPELFRLSIAHLDCDAFYAAIEKRDNPDLADKPVIVGGGKRGVVSTACYIARIHGVRSAMPMGQALRLCPDAVVVRGDFPYYRELSGQFRAILDDLSPVVEAASIDEAYLDATALERGPDPPVNVARALKTRLRGETGLTASVGVATNRTVAKIASDLRKPDGLARWPPARRRPSWRPCRSRGCGASARRRRRRWPTSE